MPLIDLWKSNPSAVDQFTIEQVVAAAGNGELKDKSKCSEELREFLTQISTVKIDDFVGDLDQRLRIGAEEVFTNTNTHQ